MRTAYKNNPFLPVQNTNSSNGGQSNQISVLNSNEIEPMGQDGRDRSRGYMTATEAFEIWLEWQKWHLSLLRCYPPKEQLKLEEFKKTCIRKAVMKRSSLPILNNWEILETVREAYVLELTVQIAPDYMRGKNSWCTAFKRASAFTKLRRVNWIDETVRQIEAVQIFAQHHESYLDDQNMCQLVASLPAEYDPVRDLNPYWMTPEKACLVKEKQRVIESLPRRVGLSDKKHAAAYEEIIKTQLARGIEVRDKNRASLQTIYQYMKEHLASRRDSYRKKSLSIAESFKREHGYWPALDEIEELAGPAPEPLVLSNLKYQAIQTAQQIASKWDDSGETERQIEIYKEQKGKKAVEMKKSSRLERGELYRKDNMDQDEPKVIRTLRVHVGGNQQQTSEIHCSLLEVNEPAKTDAAA